MSPSRFSAGMTSGSPVDAISSANVASISCGSYGDAGVPLGRRVHLLLEHPLVGRARRCTSGRRRPWRRCARPRGTRTPRRRGRPIARSARCGTRPRRRPRPRATPSRRRRRRPPCARPRSGACTPPNGTTPGIRRPGADDHLAADLLAQDPVRRADVVARLRRHRRRLQPEAVLADRGRRLVHDARSCVARRLSSERSKRGSSTSSPITSGASTRSDSSSSSWPVWSPSRTTIVFSSTAAKISDGASVREAERQMARAMGWRREGSKGRFRYVDAAGRQITDEAKLERIDALAIPPAWKDVWIAPTARAKLQATGVDAAGRKQYLYHPALPRAAGAGEVRQADPLRRAAARAARGDGRAHGARRAAARSGSRRSPSG